MRARSALLVALALLCSACPGGRNATPVTRDGCRVSGCSGEVCRKSDVASPCGWRPEFACYRSATCELQSSGECGWTQSPRLVTCIEAARRTE